MAPIAIVLHGTTSAGKSSLAKALQDSSDVPVFHISMDAFVEMSRRRDMRSEAELNQALRLHQQNLQLTLRRVAESHFDIVLDLVLRDEAQFSACLEALSSRPTFVIGVYCPLEVLEERERIRADRAPGMARSQIGHPAYDRAYSMKLDTSKVTPEEGARMIRNFVQAQIAPNTAVNPDAAQVPHLLP
jgi:chloramphenicol 3-O phosphotransferase